MKYLTKLLEVSDNAPEMGGILYIEKDEHRSSYEDMEQSLINGFSFRGIDEEDQLELNESLKSCRASGHVWRVQYYSDTPVGFYVSYKGTLEEACKDVLEGVLGPDWEKELPQ